MSSYYGIADCHGLESFLNYATMVAEARFEGKDGDVGWNSIIQVLIVRAKANRHRHAVAYEADVPIATANKIDKLLAKGKYKEALLVLKEVPDIKVAKDNIGAEKSWRMIPNSALDPYYPDSGPHHASSVKR